MRFKKHDLKTWPVYFEPVWKGEKTFELRYDDRGYRAGDLLYLREWSKSNGYTGRTITAVVNYLLSGFGLQKNWVAMSIDILTTEST